MSDEVIIYISLFVGFVLLFLAIRYLPIRKLPNQNQVLMYYQMNLPEIKITTISSFAMEEKSLHLQRNNYELVFLTDLNLFTYQGVKLPADSFLIALNDTYSYALKKALPVLIKEHVSIIIFLHVLVSSDNSKYQQKNVQQLNEFIFSEEFKNVFSYAQTIY